MSRKHHHKQDTTRTQPSPESSRFDPHAVISVCGLGLYFTRFFVPAESAHLGDTVWIVQLWLALATFACFMKWRFGEPFRFDMRDAAVWTLVVAHVVGALIVICTDGQKRAATNLLWEWVGVGVAFSMLKESASQPNGLRRLLAGLVIVLIVLSGLGFWQHYFWYPQQRELLLEFEQLTSVSPRYRELAEQLGPLANTLDPTAAYVLRQRLMESSEPMGRFALANTLGGLLAVGVILLSTSLVSSLRRKLFSRGTAVLLVATILIAGCLLLTKSRTAGVGLLAGFVVWTALTFRRRALPRQTVIIAGGLLVVFGLLITVITVTGGLDLPVVTESPKSMQYRVEYWTGAWGAIGEAPLFGVGPGNFRQHYLRYKLPGSSEEILDPHNLFLDVWANAGVLALVGLLAVLICGFVRMRRTTSRLGADDPVDQTTVTRPAVGNSAFDGTLARSWLVTCILLLMPGIILGVDWQIMVLAVSALVVGLVLRRSGAEVRFGAAATCAAAVALLVHLLGQGGIAMPVISLTLLLIFLPAPPTGVPRSFQMPEGGAVGGLATVTACVLTFACLFNATLPVLSVGIITNVARYEAANGNYRGAREQFQSAADADPLDPGPWQGLGELALIEWQRDPTPDDADFQRAMQHLQQAVARNPHHAKLKWSLGQWEFLRFERTHAPDAVEQAILWLEQAVDGYPNHAGIRSDYAIALEAAGRSQAAHAVAARAIQLDDLNIQREHYDKQLSNDARRLMEQL